MWTSAICGVTCIAESKNCKRKGQRCGQRCASMADEEVTIEKVKSEQERLDANKRKAEEDGAVIELSGDEADAAAVTPAPKKKKKAKRELPPAPCVCGVIAKGVERRDTKRCMAAGNHKCVCEPIYCKRPILCRGDPEDCPCICKKLLAHERNWGEYGCHPNHCNAEVHDCLCTENQPELCRAHVDNPGRMDVPYHAKFK